MVMIRSINIEARQQFNGSHATWPRNVYTLCRF